MKKRFYDNYDYEEAYQKQCEKLEEWELEKLMKDGKVACLYRTTTTKSQNIKSGTKTREESVIEANMAAVDDCFKRPVVKAIAELAAGKPLKNITLEETLETINKNLALLVKGDWLTVEQSAAVLTVAMDAYKQARKGKGE